MKEKVIETIKKNKLIINGDKVVLGVSGGPDSISMLNVLREIKEEKIIEYEIVVAHINHLIREEAIEDEEYVKNYCEKNKNIAKKVLTLYINWGLINLRFEPNTTKFEQEIKKVKKYKKSA